MKRGSAVDVEVIRARFIKAYSAVPSKMREEIIALVDNKPFNWNSAYIEVSQKTTAGDEILKHLDHIGLLRE